MCICTRRGLCGKRKRKPQSYRHTDSEEENDMVEELTAEGEIKVKGDGSFEVFSREAKDGTGEIAHAGDYIKLDSSGKPYPNSAEFFEKKSQASGTGIL